MQQRSTCERRHTPALGRGRARHIGSAPGAVRWLRAVGSSARATEPTRASRHCPRAIKSGRGTGARTAPGVARWLQPAAPSMHDWANYGFGGGSGDRSRWSVMAPSSRQHSTHNATFSSTSPLCIHVRGFEQSAATAILVSLDVLLVEGGVAPGAARWLPTAGSTARATEPSRPPRRAAAPAP